MSKGVVFTTATNNRSGDSANVVIQSKSVSPETPIFKIIVAGEGGVGKTSIIQRYMSECNDEPVMTVGSGFAYQELDLENQKIGLSIWDFGGEDRFRELMPIFCLGAHGAFVVFDLGRYSTFLQLEFWLEVIHKSTEGIPIILVGAKSDLVGGPRDEDIKALCREHGICAYFPVSAINGDNIENLFTYMAGQMLLSMEDGSITPAYSLKV